MKENNIIEEKEKEVTCEEKKEENKENLLDNYMFNKNKLLGKGSFGSIYIGTNKKTGEEVAIKVEQASDEISQLKIEYKAYKILEGGYGFPKVYDFYEDKRKNVLIMEMLGPSLEKLFNQRKKKFSLLTVIMIIEQILYRLEYIHSKNLVHRDIKPDNFLIGKGNNNKLIYVIDLGLSKKYKENKTGLHIPYRDGKYLTGTARYASINTHLGVEQTRRDDIEALGYMMIYLIKGHLPWQGMVNSNPEKKYDKIKDLKIKIKLEELCQGLPKETVKFIQYARDMRYDDKPNYSYLRGLLRKIAFKNGLKMDYNKFDWVANQDINEE
jgi:casein kinase 1